MFNVLDDGGVKKKVITFLVNASTQRIYLNWYSDCKFVLTLNLFYEGSETRA